jgi:ABC-type lipoprotein export system ATPase subunit
MHQGEDGGLEIHVQAPENLLRELGLAYDSQRPYRWLAGGNSRRVRIPRLPDTL